MPRRAILPMAAAVVVLIAGIAMYVASHVVPRPLVCESRESLAESYRTRFFLRVAFAESAALFGFVAVVLSAAPWVYLVGAAITAIGFAELAPTAAHLARDQEELRDRGCNESLLAALRPPAQSP